MSYNINNDPNRSWFKYNFSEDKEVPLYMPIDESMKHINSHKLNIDSKLKDRINPKQFTITEHHTKPFNYTKFETFKPIKTKRFEPRVFNNVSFKEPYLRKTWGLRHVEHKAPVNEASIEFNLHGKNTGDIARSNLLKEGGTLDDLGARIQGHNKGTSLQDAIDSFMSMSKIEQNQNKDVKVGILSSNPKKLRPIPVKPIPVKPIPAKPIPVKPVVPPIVDSISADEKDEDEIKAMIKTAKKKERIESTRPRSNTLPNEKSVKKAEKKEKIESTPKDIKTRPRSNTSQKEKSVIDAMVQGSPQYVKKAVKAKEEEIESHFDDPYSLLSTDNKHIVDAILIGDKRQRIGLAKYMELQNIFPTLEIPLTKGRLEKLIKPSKK